MRTLLLFLGFLISSTVMSQPDFKSDRAYAKYLKKELKRALKNGDHPIEKKLSPAACQADLTILKRSLEEAQTTLYRYAKKTEVEAVFDQAFTAAQDSLTYLEFMRLIAKIQHVIACGHSRWGHNPAYIQYRNANVKLLPFQIAYVNKQWTIIQNNSLNTEIMDGAIIHEINGESSQEIANRIKTYMGRDGTSNDESNSAAAKYFSMAYSNFIDQPTEFNIEISQPTKRERHSFILQGQTKNEIDSIQKIRYPDWKKRGLPLTLEIDEENNAAFYTIEWFRKEYIKSKGQDFETFTDSVFAVVANQNITNLFIDLRGNTGGWTAYGKYLFAYFIKEPQPYMTNVVANKYWDYSFESIQLFDPDYDDSMDMQLNKNGLYEWKNYPSLIAYPPDKNIYSGNTYILIDNFTYSCSGMFCSLMREHTNAIFVGEETGATQCGAGGILTAIKLPYSQITYRFSTAKYTCAVKEPTNSRGVLPDIEIGARPKTVNDFAYYIDLVKKK